MPDVAPLWRHVESTAHRILALYGYDEVRTPIVEHRDLFYKTTGEDTDIVEKQMFTIAAGDDVLALRPEGTPGVVRAYVEHNLFKTRQFRKLYYIGPMFRYERPQAGRFRQFHQIGVEAIGSSDPLLDVETIRMMAHLFDALGLTGYTIRLNTLGCPECRVRRRADLTANLRGLAERLCADCRRRLERNVLRVLDCKNEPCRAAIRQVIAPGDSPVGLCEADRARFEFIRSALENAGLPLQVDPYLVRGLDYYNHEVYEAVHAALGAQDSLGGGGRYDRLVASQDGPDVGATGFALGFERLVLAIQSNQPERLKALTECGPTVYVVAIGDQARTPCLELAERLRRTGISAELDFERRGLKAQMRCADRLGCRFAAVLGSDEIAAGQVTVKDLSDGSESKIPAENAADFIQQRISQRGDSHAQRAHGSRT